MSAINWAHRWPAGLPCGMPGKGDVMDGAIQQAPQPARQVGSDWQDMVKVQRRLPTIQGPGAPPIRDAKPALCLTQYDRPATKRNLSIMRHILRSSHAAGPCNYGPLHY
ncbi:hypothetical protein [Cupriavidus sp.]|uniref:hypothetical protein n=2 Tax=Cupriavidus TaxID=106589 RepID=UPI0025C642A3|nr:hypothetical protein [Cupriavidus sp.]MCA3206196.1 hypothetical protein [Cupriavidus sp.]